MITIENETFENLRVDFAINRGEWFGETWIILVNAGFDQIAILVEADNTEEAIDELLDSRRAYLLTVGKSEPIEEWHSFGGNSGVRYDTEQIRYIGRCKVNYFAPQRRDR